MSEGQTLAQRLTEEYNQLHDKDVDFYNEIYIPEHNLDMEIQEIVNEYGSDKPGLEEAIDKALRNGWRLQLDTSDVEKYREESIRDIVLHTLQVLGANSETLIDKLLEAKLPSLTRETYDGWGMHNDTSWAFEKNGEVLGYEEFAEHAYDFYREG